MSDAKVYKPERSVGIFENPKDPDIRRRLILNKFHGKVNKVEREFHYDKKQPFCGSCAKKDFYETTSQQSEREKSMGSKRYKVDFDESMENFDLSPYSKISRFEILKDTDALAEERSVVVGGIRKQVKIGLHKNYRCKDRGCMISIFWSNEELQSVK